LKYDGKKTTDQVINTDASINIELNTEREPMVKVVLKLQV